MGQKEAATIEERIKRLEDIAVNLCEVATSGDYSWQSWADPLHEFIKEIKKQRSQNEQ